MCYLGELCTCKTSSKRNLSSILVVSDYLIVWRSRCLEVYSVEVNSLVSYPLHESLSANCPGKGHLHGTAALPDLPSCMLPGTLWRSGHNAIVPRVGDGATLMVG